MTADQKIKSAIARPVRAALVRYMRAAPRPDPAGPEPVTILLGSAWGMGGTIRATLNLAGHLAQRRPVEIVSVMRSNEEPFFPHPPNVTVTDLGTARAVPLPLRPLRPLLRRVPSVLMNPFDQVHEIASLWTDVTLARLLRRRGGFVVGTRPAFNILAATVARPGVVTIGQEHMFLGARNPEIRRAMGRAYPRLDAVAVLTEGDRRRFERILGGSARVVRIPNAAPVDVGPPARLEGMTVLAAGRLRRQKGFDRLVKAFARVAPERPGWRLVICGEGPSRARLERMIERRGLQGVVSLPGAVDWLHREAEEAAMFVLSSRYEGFPLVLLEAMAKGLACISYRCPTGPEDLIEDRHDGLLVYEGSIWRLARRIRLLMDDPELRKRLGAAAAEKARGYGMDSIGAQWDALLDELGGAPAASDQSSLSSRSFAQRGSGARS